MDGCTLRAALVGGYVAAACGSVVSPTEGVAEQIRLCKAALTGVGSVAQGPQPYHCTTYLKIVSQKCRIKDEKNAKEARIHRRARFRGIIGSVYE